MGVLPARCSKRFVLTKGSSSRYAIHNLIRLLNDYELQKANVLKTDSSMSYHC